MAESIAPSFGRLERVELRTAWLREDTEFTPWLAAEENIAVLGDAIGIELEVEGQEEAVGPFRADILCKDTATGNWVLVENQLERTDHSHLGQLLTYAAGLSCVSIVWIAKRFTDEHRAALDWLNEKTEEGVNFFGLEIELWRIGNSPVAPKFNVVSKPNGWTKSVVPAVGNSAGKLTPMKELQLEFWRAFIECARERSTGLKFGSPQAQNWMPIAIGRSGFFLNAVASSWSFETSSYASGELRAELVMNDASAKAYFAMLSQNREIIETELGESLTWYSRDDIKSCKVFLRRDGDINDRSAWEEYAQWLLTKIEALNRVLRPHILALDVNRTISIQP